MFLCSIRNKIFVFIILVNSIGRTLYAQKNKDMYDEHLIPVMNKQGKWGYLNTDDNKIIIEPKYDWAGLFQDGIAQVSVKNPDAATYDNSSLIGWIDTTGKEIFAPQFTQVYNVEKYGDIDGKNIIDGLKEVVTKNGETGIVSLPGGKWKVSAGLYNDFYFYDKNHFLADKKYFFSGGKKYATPKGYIITNIDTSAELFYIQKENDDAQSGLCTWNGKVLMCYYRDGGPMKILPG